MFILYYRAYLSTIQNLIDWTTTTASIDKQWSTNNAECWNLLANLSMIIFYYCIESLKYPDKSSTYMWGYGIYEMWINGISFAIVFMMPLAMLSIECVWS